MALTRAGTAYVNVQLGSLTGFKRELASGVKKAAATAGRDAGKTMAQSMNSGFSSVKSAAASGLKNFKRELSALKPALSEVRKSLSQLGSSLLNLGRAGRDWHQPSRNP